MAVSAFRPEAAKRRSNMNPNHNGEHHENQDEQHHHHRNHRHHHHQQHQQQQQQHHHHPHRRRHHHHHQQQQEDQLDPRRRISCTSSSMAPNRPTCKSKLDPPPCPADPIDRINPRRVHARSRHYNIRPCSQASEHERSDRVGYHERRVSSSGEQCPDAQVEEKFVLSVHPQNDQAQETSSERVSHNIDRFNRAVFSEEILELFKYVCKFYMVKVEKAEEEVRELRRQLVEQRLKYMNLRSIVDRFMSDRGYKDYGDRLHGIGNRSSRDVDTDGNGSEEEEDDDDDDDGDDNRVIGCEVSSRSTVVPHPSSEDDHSSFDNMDGLVLPWLQWDATNNIALSCPSGQLSTRQKQEWLQRSDSVCLQSCNKLAAFSKVGQKEQNHGFAKLRQWQVWDGSGEQKGGTERSRLVAHADNAHVESIDDVPSETCFVYVRNMELMSERIRFQSRIESGELLLCIGTLHYNMF